THFFDAIETILQRSNGDHEIAAAFQIIRIRAWTVLGGVKSINSASKVRDQPLDLRHGLCRHNAALGSDVNLMFHFSPPRNNCPTQIEPGAVRRNWGPNSRTWRRG